MGLAAVCAAVRYSLECLYSLHWPLHRSVLSSYHEEEGVVAGWTVEVGLLT